MKNIHIYILIVFFTHCFLVNAQDKMLKKANKSFYDFNYTEAIKQYEELIEKGMNTPEIYKNLGDANYWNAQYAKAAMYYQKLLSFNVDIMDVEHMYRYAISLRTIKQYEESDEWIQRLNMIKMGGFRGKNLTLNSDYLEKIRERSGNYSIENLSINSAASDFAPSFHKECIVFASARDAQDGIMKKNIHNWNKAVFLNLYTAKVIENQEFENPTPFSKKMNTKMHESSTVFTRDGKTVYFTRNNQSKGNFSRDEKGVSRLQLFKAELINGKWEKVKALPFNADHYSVAHPALNENEDKLYFSSDMPGTLGDSDIFVVDIKPNGSYGTPKNLGNKINTESKETFPFVEKDILYFASDGHPGLGGMDIFAVDLKEDKEESLIVNLAEPINSISDDFSLIYNSETEKGYFASNRIGGKGDDDIYSFVKDKVVCTQMAIGTVSNKTNKKPIANAMVKLFDEDDKLLETVHSDMNGAFSFKEPLECKRKYIANATKEKYEEDSEEFETSAVLGLELALSMELNPIIELVYTDKGVKKIKIENLNFDLDKHYIRPDAEVKLNRLVAIMTEYPSIVIKIESHTDSRSSKLYNQRLSDQRAKSTRDYIISKGIAPNRIESAIGYGEERLLNECKDGVKCSNAKHDINRRSDFIITKM